MRQNVRIGIILTSIVFIAGGTGVYFFFIQTNEAEPVVCTQEAKLCPDGSYVSREGPNCEFAECPNVIKKQAESAEWEVYRNKKYGFETLLPKGAGGLTILNTQNENDDPNFIYESWSIYDVLFGTKNKGVAESLSVTLLKYRDSIFMVPAPYGGKSEVVNLKQLREHIAAHEPGIFVAHTESGYFDDLDPFLQAAYEYAITPVGSGQRTIRQREVRQRGQAACIPPTLVYEFFENGYYIAFRIQQPECYNNSLDNELLKMIVATFKFTAPNRNAF